MLMMNRYKTWKKYGLIQTKVPKKLKDVIDLWLDKSQNRDYLITKANGVYNACKEDPPEQAEGFSSLVARVFNRFLREDKTEKSIGINRIRQIWAGYIGTLSIDKQRDMARKMAHSLEMNKGHYRRQGEGEVQESIKEWEHLKDFGEKEYPYTKQEILANKHIKPVTKTEKSNTKKKKGKPKPKPSTHKKEIVYTEGSRKSTCKRKHRKMDGLDYDLEEFDED